MNMIILDAFDIMNLAIDQTIEKPKTDTCPLCRENPLTVNCNNGNCDITPQEAL
jgi:hypothetical protein